MGLQLSLDYQYIPHNWNKIAKTFLKGDSVDVNNAESVQGFIDVIIFIYLLPVFGSLYGFLL